MAGRTTGVPDDGHRNLPETDPKWLQCGGKGFRVERSGLTGGKRARIRCSRRRKWEKPPMVGRFVGAVRASARREGPGRPARQVPRLLREGGVSHHQPGGVFGAVDPGRVRTPVRSHPVPRPGWMRRTATGPGTVRPTPGKWTSTGRGGWPFTPSCGNSPSWRPRGLGQRCDRSDRASWDPRVWSEQVGPEEQWFLGDRRLKGPAAPATEYR